jgi:hypothetical protein
MRNKWKEKYESAKQKLKERNLPQAEYEKEIIKLCRKYRL